ncbi:U32 family peptidase [Candidatus Woesearchaeota archaeon]|nr:U32 family peptidase [Candidatus Woesearchaeota archaeon]
MKPELIAPVGNLPMLSAAINAKADAVYFGVKELNMRITANNFELSQIKKVVEQCHKNNVKAYLTLNTIIYDDELEKVRKLLKQAKKAGIDAVIAWDFAVLEECKKQKIPIHLSTQASVSNFGSLYSYYKRFKIKRAVLARECSLEQIKEIIKKIKNKKIKVEIEVFVHGAMCVSMSGRCFTSQFVFGKSANRGDCLQNCRREYKIIDEEGNELRLGNNYVMSAKDLCTLPFLDRLIDAGINGFKIEGRNRSAEYVSVVTECYGDILKSMKKFNIKKSLIKKNKNKSILKKIKNNIQKLKTVYNRDFSTGFYLGKPIDEWTDSYGGKATKKKFYVGKIKNFYKKIKVAELLMENKPLKLNDEIIIIGNKTGAISQNISSMEIKHKKIKTAKKGQRIAIKLNKTARENDKVFVVQ